ncbi:TIGR01457 family HAD-type hydrolase [Latilactobacillus graminis]|uniref:Acid sugar phosphatase n=2 Tax=Latilactobacillus graminis TaxID=60519 RepID=A0AA89I2F6_9LACO|nr:TIGR01457 family HAD-type hydrolase [Latilactobacillus graminis]KRM24438.1 hydrolase, haloacid dehalogenase family [Latilactobacillus graminis DSM 20719]QFP80013.1 TIGR01457 family HAD-type hydrolase [Latilactobacillus graminis]
MTNTPYSGYLIDLDGTVYRGRNQMPAAKDFIERLQAKKIPFMFLTNNTTKSPDAVIQNLADNHAIHATVDQVYTPALATARYLLNLNDGHVNGKTVYVIGELGLKQALADAGFRTNEYDPDYVVVGLDYDVTYHKFELATLAIKRGALFIGTNADTNLPNERGLVPGAGSVIAMVERATQQHALYIGKPEKIIVEMALAQFGLTKDQVVMVGDNYNTDIKAGLNSGMDTLLVYTGVSTPEEVAKETLQPTYAIHDLTEWDV